MLDYFYSAFNQRDVNFSTPFKKIILVRSLPADRSDITKVE
jgi:hypothetical protein